MFIYTSPTTPQTVWCILALGWSGRCNFHCCILWRRWSSYKSQSPCADYQRRRICYAQSCAGGDQFINHGRFMPGHSSVCDNSHPCTPVMGGDNGGRYFRIGYRIDGNVNGCGPIDFCDYAVFAFGAGGEKGLD